jgi:hypothetical protein
MPGGTLHVELDEADQLFLSGRVATVFTGEIAREGGRGQRTELRREGTVRADGAQSCGRKKG